MNWIRGILRAGNAVLLALVATILAGGLTVFATASDSSGTTRITLTTSTVKQGNINAISISAHLADSEKPVGGEPVDFEVATDFFGDQQVNIGNAVTDATGTASIIYEPRWQGTHVITAHFRGDGSYPHVEVTTTISYSGLIPAYQPEPVGLQAVREWITPIVGLAIIGFWVFLILLAVYVLRGISRGRKTATLRALERKLDESVSERRPLEIK
jgi:hypothetical protein